MGDRLAAIGASVPPDRLVIVGDYLGRLIAMNERMNLTAITDEAAAWERHALDALSLLPQLAGFARGARLLDVGSGGGIPGIPLAIARPDLAITLIEATQKKCSFLSSVADELGLTNVTVHADRAEKLARGPLAGTFDVVTARAVAKIEALVPLVAPFAKKGGLLLFIKGQRADEEIAEAKKVLSGRVQYEATVATPTGRIVRLVRM